MGLRVAVKARCSGLTYDLKITDEELESDKIVEQYGVKVMVDKKSYIYLVGTELDFSDGLNGKGFTFENPNAKKACGWRHLLQRLSIPQQGYRVSTYWECEARNLEQQEARPVQKAGPSCVCVVQLTGLRK